ncbi:aldolase [Xylariaceae sp. FL1651]|nr:aldolase [Xylariaceae sp. FL1651]
MRLSSSFAAALLSFSVEATSVRLPYARRADNVTAGVPPPPGTYVPVPTFFLGQNSSDSSVSATSYALDLDTQVAYSKYLADAGITGFAIFGSTGEPIHVSNDERVKVISATRKALDEAGYTDYPLVAGVVSQLFEEVIDQLQKAKDAGAQWGVCLVPGYFAVATSQQGIIDWFTAVADKSPMPILIYDYPVVTNGIKVQPSTYEALAKHPNIVGAKLAMTDISWHSQISSNPNIDYTHFHPYTGLGQQMLAAVTLGAFGAFDVVGSFFPKSMVQLYKLSALEQPTPEQKKAARDLQYQVAAMGEYLNSWYVYMTLYIASSCLVAESYNILGIKEAISRLRGFGDRTGVRLPLLNTITEDEWDAYSDIVSIMEETEKSL